MPPSYLPSERKGEVNELKGLLRDPTVEKDNNKRREVLKKVLALMTLGIDTTALFTEVIIACATNDLVQKKMIYLYLATHSEQNSEIAILTINTLQKDCKDDSPLCRGLALRSLASLRLPQIADYLVPTLKQCLSDTAPYVRKTAILATLKLFRVAPETFRGMGLVDKMYGMLRDNDSLVACNALAVLQEVLVDDGGIKVTKPILYFLLNRMRDMTEWQQCQVLELVIKYTPANENEMFDIMNLLEERLRGSNSAVIVACAHVFLYLTQNLPAVHQQVFSRLKVPLLTLVATATSVEVSYAVLCHVKLLVQRDPKPFIAGYKDFYCRHTDPSYTKCVKIEILTSVASDANMREIVTELVAYVSDMNCEVSRRAIDAIGRIALQIEGREAPKLALQYFLELLMMDMEHVRGETLVVMKDYLRKYNDIETVRPFLTQIVESYKTSAFDDEQSKVALVWILGEFGEHIEDAPYLLEGFVNQFNTLSVALRMEILTAVVKLFYKRPPEVQPVMATMFIQSINDFSHADVHDRALLYYRLLRLNPRAAMQVICVPKAPVRLFFEDQNSDTRDKLFEEFNSLSVVYNVPQANFLKTRAEVAESESDEEHGPGEGESEQGEEQSGEKGLLSQPVSGGPRPNGKLLLSEDADIDSPEFQGRWAKLPVGASLALRLKAVPPIPVLEDALVEQCIMLLASGTQGSSTKVYIYAKPEDDDTKVFLAELLIQMTGAVQITVKSDDTRGPMFVEILKKAMAPYCA